MFIRFLSACRFLLAVPVLGCVLLTAGVVAVGFARIVGVTGEVLGAGDYSQAAAKSMALAVIEIIDLFLIGTVSYITAVGLYKLFIGTREVRLPARLNIESLQDLENKIIGVIVAALAVAFLGQAAGPGDVTALLNYGGGIAVVIAALAYFTGKGGKGGKDGDESEGDGATERSG